jgi:hypothetical protein
VLRQACHQAINQATNVFVVITELVDVTISVKNCGMIATSEIPTDFFQAVAGKITGQIHAYLARKGNAATATSALQVAQTNIKMIGYRLDYL